MIHENTSSGYKHGITCTYVLGLEGVIVGDVGLVQCLQRYNMVFYGNNVAARALMWNSVALRCSGSR